VSKHAIRRITAILSILLLSSLPTHAAPIGIREVVQVFSNYQTPPDLRIGNTAQISQTATTSQRKPGVDQAPATSDTYPLDGTIINSDPNAVAVIDLGEIEGTVCDCGDISVPVAGFPKWPLLFLAGIPFLFLPHCDNCDTPESFPTPTPPPTHTPEPASMLLFGSSLIALGAGLRRRNKRTKLMRVRDAEEL
jgi:hypothetical protein